MKVEYKSVEPNFKSLDHELIFSFFVSDISANEYLQNVTGELFSEDGYKISNLFSIQNQYEGKLNTKKESKQKRNSDFIFKLVGGFSEKSIAHIENYRLNQKERTKDVVFKIKLNLNIIESHIDLASVHIGHQTGADSEKRYEVYYKYVQHHSPRFTDMWLLSADGSEHFFTSKNYQYPIIEAGIDLMNWVNNYSKYLNIGEFLVYEFLKPESSVFNKTLKERYDKAQQALKEMQKQLNYGEWKQAIIASRPIVELFNHFDDFKKFLVEHEYSEEAYNDLKKTINAFFDLLSKFYHALKKGNKDINPEIHAYKEDAYMAYSFSVTLLHLISQKAKRKN